MKKESLIKLRKKYNTLELKYLILLEDYNEMIKSKIDKYDEIDKLNKRLRDLQRFNKNLKKKVKML